MTNMEAIWEAERQSYRIQFIDEVLPLIKDLIHERYIVSTRPEKPKAITDVDLYNEIEKIIRNV
jgi:hypothetical protein